MVEHELKVATVYFDAVTKGDKPFEVRRDDRGFQKGDRLILRRYGVPSHSALNAPSYLRGEKSVPKSIADQQTFDVTYILTGGQFGIEPGFVVMGVRKSEPSS